MTTPCVVEPVVNTSYGARCIRGPTFVSSGYGSVDDGQDGGSMSGTVIVPSIAILNVWASMCSYTVSMEGLWTPWETVCCIWDSSTYVPTINDNLMFEPSLCKMYSFTKLAIVVHMTWGLSLATITCRLHVWMRTVSDLAAAVVYNRVRARCECKRT